jgi:N-acetylglucosamine kinase-like BadF-type ATPase
MAILTIDQGQTKTIALVLEQDGRILGVGKAQGASHFKVGLARASQAMQEAAKNALIDGNLKPDAITEVCGGIAAANWPEEIAMLEEELRRAFGVNKAVVINDCVIALRAGTDSDDAIVLCTGSGMNSAVFAGGKLALVYNNYIGLYDQGSEGIGARAFKAAFESHMHCGEKTTLEKRLMDHFGIHDMDRLMLAFYRNQLPKPLKEVARIVFEEAMHNEPAALEVLYSFGKSISQYVIGAVRRFQMDPSVLRVILSGGVFKNENPLLYETVCSQIHRVYANIRIEQSFYEPIIGAALMALDERGPKTDKAHETVKEEARRLGLVRCLAEKGEAECRL